MRSFVALFRTPTKGVSIDPNATEGAIVGENLFIRATDGSLSLFEPSSGVVTPASGAPATTVTITPGGMSTSTQSVGGSNSGYAPEQSPAAAPTNYDLDLSMIAGLGQTAFPTVNTILIGDGTQWVAKQMTGDASILASGAINVFPGANMAASATMPNRRVRFTANSVAGTFPVPASDFQDQYVLIESALTGCSVVANSGYTVNGLASWSLDITPCYVHFIANTNPAVKNWFVAEIRVGSI